MFKPYIPILTADKDDMTSFIDPSFLIAYRGSVILQEDVLFGANLFKQKRSFLFIISDTDDLWNEDLAGGEEKFITFFFSKNYLKINSSPVLII